MALLRKFWDLETTGLPIEQITPLMPEFEAGKNIKDIEKIKADIEQKKADWLDKAALKAITGKIVAFTICNEDGEPEMSAQTDEKTLIDIAISDLREVVANGGKAYAWNGHGFDLPFLCQRAAVYGIPAFHLFTTNFRGRYSWNEAFCDPKLVWSNYSPDHTGASLKSVALALGVGVKDGSGKDFAALLKTDPIKAKEYALNDCRLLRAIVNRMGL